MSQDNRPKLMHTLSRMLVKSQTQKGFLSKPYIMGGSVLISQAWIFERCGILGTLCQDIREPFFRVLAGTKGLEEEGIAAVGSMANNYVMPFIDDSPTILNLIVNHARAKVGFDGDFVEFLQKYGMEKLPTDKAAVSIAVWASLGGYIGLEHSYLIEDWIHWMYDEPEDLGFTWEQAREIGLAIGEKNPYNSALDVQREAINIFDEFCKEFYPEELEHFMLIERE